MEEDHQEAFSKIWQLLAQSEYLGIRSAIQQLTTEASQSSTSIMESDTATLLRLIKRRVPAEKRQRTEMSCDWCMKKRCKCLRLNPMDSCRACNEIGQQCLTTKPRKRRHCPTTVTNIEPEEFIATQESEKDPMQSLIQYSTAKIHEQSSSSTFASDNAFNKLAKKSETAVTERPKQRWIEPLFEDSLGLPRYIGPMGSYTLLVKLWEIMATKCTSLVQSRDNAQTMGHSMLLYNSTGQGIELPPREAADTLVNLFFEKVHCDFPIFHRALFQATYEGMWSQQPELEPAWLMSLSMVFILGLEVAPQGSGRPEAISKREEMKLRYLSKAKGFLPDVISGSTLSHVQALMLYSRYLHITSNRNACWNIAGSAIRLAVAIGLHRNGTHVKCSPLERELRKRVWWTLYGFERMECSSLGRTSAISDDEFNVGVPTEGMLDMGDSIPLGYVNAQAKLMRILGSICKHQYGLEDGLEDKLEFTAQTSAQLDIWYSNLPLHLKLDSNSPESHLRAILLIHTQYHYTITLLYRPFLISLATETSSKESGEFIPKSYAQTCINSAKAAVSVLNKLFQAGHFNSKTWWDIYFIEAVAMILAMGRFIDLWELKKDTEILESLKTCVHIIQGCEGFSPTMSRFASVTSDFAQAVLFEQSTNSQAVSEEHETPVTRDPQTNQSTCNFDDTQDILSPPVDDAAFEAIMNAANLNNRFYDPNTVQWNFADLSQQWKWD
jgi:hypothetical protein